MLNLNWFSPAMKLNINNNSKAIITLILDKKKTLLVLRIKPLWHAMCYLKAYHVIATFCSVT